VQGEGSRVRVSVCEAQGYANIRKSRSGSGWGSKESLCDQQKVVTSMKKSNGNLLWWHYQEILWWRGGRQGVCC